MVGTLIAENVLIWSTKKNEGKDKDGRSFDWFQVMYLNDDTSNTLSCDKDVFPKLAKGQTCDLEITARMDNGMQRFKITGVRDKKKN